MTPRGSTLGFVAGRKKQPREAVDVVVARNIKMFMHERGLTAEQLAVLAGLAVPTVNKYLSGANRCREPKKIADALARSVDDLYLARPPEPKEWIKPAFWLVPIEDQDKVDPALWKEAKRVIAALNQKHIASRPRRQAMSNESEKDRQEQTLTAPAPARR